MPIITSPEKFDGISSHGLPTVFLGGSIEQGTAEDWQQKAIDRLQEKFVLLNPRREHWDAEKISDPAYMDEQVNWELDAILSEAQIVIMYFAPGTKSPISLLELGVLLGQKAWDALHASQDGREARKLYVCCPNGFWRKENVDITCAKFGQFVYEDFDLMIEQLSADVEKPFFEGMCTSA